MRVALYGYLFEPSGYGEFARLIAAALLTQTDLDVVPIPIPLYPEEPSRFGWKGDLIYSSMRPIDRADVTLAICDPEGLRRATTPADRRVAFTMFERETRLSLIAAICDQHHHVIVPTDWNRRALAAHGISPGISVVEPPLDLLDYHRTEPEPGECFTFLAAFDWSASHKDPLGLLEAYLTAFGPEDRVLLRIKAAHRNPREAEALIRRDIEQMAYACGRRDFPPVEIVLGSWTREETLSEMTRADVFVAPHRAEGWGLPLFEAMGLGVPCIATSYGGSLAFARGDHDLTCDMGWDCVCGANATLVPPLTVADGWATPDVPAMAREMRSAYEGEEPMPRDCGDLARRFTMEATAARMVDVLREVT